MQAKKIGMSGVITSLKEHILKSFLLKEDAIYNIQFLIQSFSVHIGAYIMYLSVTEGPSPWSGALSE